MRVARRTPAAILHVSGITSFPRKQCYELISLLLPAITSRNSCGACGSADRVKGNFRVSKLLGLITLILLVHLPAIAQVTPPGEVGVGYTFRMYDRPSFQQPPSWLSMNGWNMTADYNFLSWLGAAADLDWTGNASNGAETTIMTGTIGPQIYPFGHHKWTPFAHVLLGAGRFYYRYPCACLGSNGTSNYFSEYDFAWVAGGGLDYTVRPKVGIRLAEFDFEQVNFGLQGFGKGSMPAQNNWKYSAAFLLHF